MTLKCARCDGALRVCEAHCDMPSTPSKYQLVLNLKTARMLSLTIPPMMLARADELIE
jgi:putative ABC transport system substrate-binding protein